MLIDYRQKADGLAFSKDLVVKRCPVCDLGCVLIEAANKDTFVHEHQIQREVKLKGSKNKAVVTSACVVASDGKITEGVKAGMYLLKGKVVDVNEYNRHKMLRGKR